MFGWLFCQTLPIYNVYVKSFTETVGQVDLEVTKIRRKKMRKIALILVSLMFAGCFLTAQTYNIGDTGPGGGIVFYVSEIAFPVPQPNGETKMCRYMEVSPVDIGKSQWGDCSKEDPYTLQGLGTGLMNTYNIVSYNADKMTTANCAAYACLMYSTQTTRKGEWWLPSKVELNLLYKNLRDKVIATGSDYYPDYWSSSQGSYSDAWSQSFSDGDQNYTSKISTYFVRAVRAF